MLIDDIKAVCNEADVDALTALAKIKSLIVEQEKPDFTKITRGDHFKYCGYEWICLGAEQCGALCITAESVYTEPFDDKGCSDWRESSSRKKLNTEFLATLNESDLLDYESDLTADNGDKAYGMCRDKVGLLSVDLYRRYRELIPSYEECMWTCTPWYCDTLSPFAPDRMRIVFMGNMFVYDVDSVHAIVPACIFRL